MSKYIPFPALEREHLQHMKRMEHGLKTGTHVRFPDAEKGPFLLRKEVAEELAAKKAARDAAKPSSEVEATPSAMQTISAATGETPEGFGV